jgi:hypothetical protein
MNSKEVLAMVGGNVDEELLLRNEYPPRMGGLLNFYYRKAA